MNGAKSTNIKENGWNFKIRRDSCRLKITLIFFLKTQKKA